MTEIRVYDWRGNLRPEGVEYLYPRYGHFVIAEPAPGSGPAFHIRALRERADGDFDPKLLADLRGTPAEQAWWNTVATRAAATFGVRVVDAHGAPLQGVRVAFYWSEAPRDSDAGPAGGVIPGMEPGRALSGMTSDTGTAGLGMGKGAYFWPGQGEIGPHAVWIAGANTRSAVLLGAGMVAMTDHYHYDVEFECRDGEPGEEGAVPEFYDESGARQDEAWARGLFGAQEYHRPEGLPAYHLTGLQAASGEYRALTAQVLDVDGGPLTGVALVLFRRNVERPEPRYQVTDVNGRATFDMYGTAEHSAIDGQGQYAIGVDGAKSDFYNAAGLVMLKKAAPRWLNPTFRLTGEPDVPDPEPPGPPIPPAPIDPALRDQLLARVAVIENQCAELWALLK